MPKKLFTSLILEQVNSVGCMVPQKMVGPGPGFTFGVDIFTTEKIGLNIHLLNGNFTDCYLFMHPLMGGIEAAGMSDHADKSRFLLYLVNSLGFFPVVGKGDFHLHMFTGFHALNSLRRMQLSRCT